MTIAVLYHQIGGALSNAERLVLLRAGKGRLGNMKSWEMTFFGKANGRRPVSNDGHQDEVVLSRSRMSKIAANALQCRQCINR